MPMNGTTYVAPTWRNAQGPAIDATELQAMCNTIAGNQSKNVSQDSLISALQTAVGAGAKIEVGSYVGTGTYGADNPCSITCSFAPKLVWIYRADNSSNAFFDSVPIKPGSYTARFIVDFSALSNSYTQSKNSFFIALNSSQDNVKNNVYSKKQGNTILWYMAIPDQTVNGPSLQLNLVNVQYFWVAFS